MTNVKDKLSASVRQARAAQQPTAAKLKPATRAATESTTAKPATARQQRTATPAPAKPTPATPVPSANSVRESGSALFPDRVWPD